ncbi:n-acetylglucosaminyl transferase component gpi1 protein [Rutstroemia sp. NJR-2017a WRK4]|nr:n-acetylglucosaminyl transferase component gpi1 protein [Rutstroemia sp. NJR-2017a WRK4]PQE32346.1 n-acetylglucosaminyl transferase component gpi1 protein [Rutstroemia sp. NJR-2017a WRK4]
MHPFSILTLAIFVAGYITARWDLVTRLYELAIFAWDHGVVSRTLKGFAILSIFFFLFIIPRDEGGSTGMDTTRLAANRVPDNFLASKVWKCGNICARTTETKGFILRQRCH